MSNKLFKKVAACILAAMFTASVSTTVFAAGGAPGEPPSGGGGGANTMSYDYSGTLSGAVTADGESKEASDTISAESSDQNAALVQNAGSLAITNAVLTKTGSDTNGDNCNFYGINSILLAANEDSAAYISNSSLTADSEGSNGLFATDSGKIFAYNDTITTTAGNSRGLDATYAGSIIADSMNITTSGDHCAGAATDRGGGSVSLTNSTLNTAGSGSPLLYSTGDIEVDNVNGTATGSQIAGMEGLNTILIYNSNLASTIKSATASDPIADGIIIYQSTSGDAESTTGKTAVFNACNSTLSSAIESGSMFYITNTAANVVLSGTTLDFDSSKANLLTVCGNDSNNWGTAGKNGGTVKFTGIGESLNGNIEVDTISSLDLYLLKNTVYTGAISITDNSVNTAATDSPVTVNLDSTSKWIVTGDSEVTNLCAESGASIVDASGNTVSIVANGKTVVTGSSAYTVTVNGSYSDSFKTDSNNQLSSEYIDRTAFDSYYGTSTTFANNAVSNTKIDISPSSASVVSAVSSSSSSTKSTGGINILYFIIPGAVLVIAAVAVIVIKRRKE